MFVFYKVKPSLMEKHVVKLCVASSAAASDA